jgi:glycosyltransferase involved in cell wall biosynthesis
MKSSPLIAIAWNGLPFYAACLIRAGIEKVGEPVTVIGSKPDVPIAGMEEVLGQKIHWMDSSQPCTWSSLNLAIPEIFFHTGWSYLGFNELAEEVRRAGGKVVSMVDNCWKNSIRQWIGAIIFRLKYKKCFSAVWVPGRSGQKLCRFLGMPEHRVYQGMYGADPTIFSPGVSLSKRPKQFLFVGQFIHRKGLDILVEAFQQFQTEFPDWKLYVIGRGSLEPLLKSAGIVVQDFQQPPQVAQIMQKSRALILPSYEEHWGLVVHEAALCGCSLILSDQVGSSWDLIGDNNGHTFRSGSSNALYRAMVRCHASTESELHLALNDSLQLSSKFSPRIWAETFINIIANLRTTNNV